LYDKKILARFEIIIMHLRQILYQLLYFLPMPIPLLSGEFCFPLWMMVFSFFYNYGHVLIDLQATKKIDDAKLAKDFQAVLKEF
jgi:hypothetical protein